MSTSSVFISDSLQSQAPQALLEHRLDDRLDLRCALVFSVPAREMREVAGERDDVEAHRAAGDAGRSPTDDREAVVGVLGRPLAAEPVAARSGRAEVPPRLSSLGPQQLRRLELDPLGIGWRRKKASATCRRPVDGVVAPIGPLGPPDLPRATRPGRRSERALLAGGDRGVLAATMPWKTSWVGGPPPLALPLPLPLPGEPSASISLRRQVTWATHSVPQTCSEITPRAPRRRPVGERACAGSATRRREPAASLRAPRARSSTSPCRPRGGAACLR